MERYRYNRCNRERNKTVRTGSASHTFSDIKRLRLPVFPKSYEQDNHDKEQHESQDGKYNHDNTVS